MDTTEKNFEATIEAHLLGNGATPTGLVAEERASYGPTTGYVKRDPKKHYDRTRCLDPEALFGFIYATQPEQWEKLKTQHGEEVKTRFLRRLVKEIESRGTLDVLRRGVVDLGSKFDLAYFKPETRLNEEHKRLYNANSFSVMRQVRYSGKNENSLDVVLFLNGLPIITAELKNPMTNQTVQDAVAQYRRDRDQKEPLFAFGRCLAHFAVDPDMAYVTTHLRGRKTRFLPFNKGSDNGAGNPENPDGFKTAYLWEEIWDRDSLLDVINNFLQVTEIEDDKGKRTGDKVLIFPRYHQLDAVRRLVEDARINGPGKNYLIEHSAGSGKSNSIAWLSHRLAGLHDRDDQRVFDGIVVITDRRVLDRQLQKTVTSFEQVRGVVTTIGGRKAENLAGALEGGSQIIVTTLQTFPFVSEKIRELSGKRFAVIIDEAHSSQSGEGSRSLKEVLSPHSLDEAETEDAPEVSEEDRINAEVERTMKTRGRIPNVSFFAFTATPKNKTLEIFGTRRDDGSYEPFSLYSMRQAIEEKFILDVLKNYTTFKVYFNLLKKVEDDPTYEKVQAIALLKNYADLHEHGIARKTEQMVEHFHEQVRHRIGDRAKAMVVTRSRLHAVRFKQAFDRHLEQRGHPHKTLVAFSGTVMDPDTGLEFTEDRMNGFPETQTAETFKQNDYRFLIVANKFQTGFDQPLLHTMYVDKKLGGVNAAQTLSRLNRTHPGKEETFVLDFANAAEEIRKSFQPYYETTVLTEATDPNKLYDIKRMLEEYRIFGTDDVKAFSAVYFSVTGGQEKLHPILDAVVGEYREHEENEKTAFRKHLGDFVGIYAFLSQILTFTDADLEKLYQFSRFLLRKLPVPREKLPVEITENINMDSYRIQETSKGDIKLMGEGGQLEPISEIGTGEERPQDLAPLSEIIGYINEYFGTDFTDEDRVAHFASDMERRMADKGDLVRAFNPEVNPSKEHRRMAFEPHFDDVLHDMIDSNFDLYKKIVEDEGFGDLFKEFVFERVEKSIRGKTR